MRPKKVKQVCKRHALLLLSFSICLALYVLVTPAKATETYANEELANKAASYVGKWGGNACIDAGKFQSGQCKQFVNCIVFMVSGGAQYPVDPSGNYQNSYSVAGGNEIDSANETAKGDIIQYGETDADAAVGELHTAIVLENKGDGKFSVIDSNFSYDEKVQVHDYTPPADARFWRMGTVPAEAQKPPSTNNTVLKVIKKSQSDGTNAVYWTKPGAVFESWWRPGDGLGVRHSQLVNITQGDIRDIDMQILGDNLHLLYTATTHNVYETWWYPNQGLHTSNPPIVHTDYSIRKVVKTIAPDGVHQLYVMTDVGVDEYWWRPGGVVHGNRIYTLANPIALKKYFEADGRQVLYVADQGYVYEVWWRPGVVGITIGQIIHISQNDIVDTDLAVDAGTNLHHLFIGTKGGGAWEAKWTPGVAGIAYWHLTGDTGVRAIQVYRDGPNYSLYIATMGGVYEYWWPQSTTELHASTIVSGLGGVTEFDRSTSVDGAQAIYTAFNTNIAESYWWRPGSPITTDIIE